MKNNITRNERFFGLFSHYIQNDRISFALKIRLLNTFYVALVLRSKLVLCLNVRLIIVEYHTHTK